MGKNDNIFDIGSGKNKKGQNFQPKQITQQDVLEAPDVQCVRCGGELFLPANRLKRISKLLTGESKDQIYPMQTLVCASCGWEFGRQLPKGADEEGNPAPDETPKTAFDEEE